MRRVGYGIEGSFPSAAGSRTAARDLARVTVSFDAAAWAENMNFDAASASERRVALLEDLHNYLAATVKMGEQER
ncbi:MAG: hypothetical protein JRH11_27785 [Deltaproteobacteria bacterium]|nr:hypothetical protein [Deltaproteobacteria bacterium]